MRILAVSDKVIDTLYSPQVRTRFSKIDLVVSCGDLPYAYPEYLTSLLNASLYFIRGNHDLAADHPYKSPPAPLGGVDLHLRSINHEGLLLAGVEGSIRYKEGPFMYSQSEMWLHVFRLLPALLLNKVRYGRYLDVFVTHAPPFGVHDQADYAHQGIRAFRWFDEVFQPFYHLHGHIHLYGTEQRQTSELGLTKVINCYGYQEISIP
ncbi:MAG: metallophosphoesterase [Anaerolineae bacterium]|jgi:Icc-related predicted phosphoesterase|nr:MAG: metallophosphoesterase [Anaerolineae bacterium]